jgi:type IV pilus assembly protein PilN
VISVNLLPVEERVKESQLSVAPRFKILLPVILGAAILLPLAGISVMQRAKIQGLKEDIARAQVEKARLSREIQAVEDLVQRQAELRQRLRTLRDLVRQRATMVQVVDELARQIPPNLWLTEFSTQSPGSYSLEGSTFSNLVVADLMGRLERSDLFYDVDLSETKRNLIGSEPVIEFAITFKSGSEPEALGEMGLNAALESGGKGPGGS